jgi:hypothetical protein
MDSEDKVTKAAHPVSEMDTSDKSSEINFFLKSPSHRRQQ